MASSSAEGAGTVASAAQRSILVAVDRSDFSLHALQYALENIVTPNDRVTILHVRPQVEEHDFYAAEPYKAEFEAEYKKESFALLEKLRKLAHSIQPDRPGPTDTLSLEGDPRESILDAAKQVKADLLVVGSHGHGFLARAFLGSVSNHLLHTAPCPVLVVKQAKGVASAPIPGLGQLGKVVDSAR